MFTPHGALAGKPMVTLQGFTAPPAAAADIVGLVEAAVAGQAGGAAAWTGEARDALRARVQQRVLALTGALPVTQLFVHGAAKA